jgi:hypothetical protein
VRWLSGLLMMVGLSFVLTQLLAGTTVVATADGEQIQSEEERFLFACSGGQEDDVMKMLEEKPGTWNLNAERQRAFSSVFDEI